MIAGILAGLGAAVGQSISYLSTRHYVQQRKPGASRELLVLGHVWMGIFGAGLLAVLWPSWPIPWTALALPFVLYLAGYLSGQIALTTALRNAEASRVSPLMTSKLIVSSVLVMMFGQPVGESSRFLTPLQWLAVGLCVIAGISINVTGGKMTRKAVLAIACAAISFSLSDWGINLTIKAMLTAPTDQLHAGLVTDGVAYTAKGVLALLLLPSFGTRKARDWVDAAPFAITWFAAMIGLFIAFSLVGILLGSILQCTRGFITILLGAAIMHLGHHHIEPLAPRRVMIRRLLAGLLMFVGISMYVIKDGEHLRMLMQPGQAAAVR